jgi:hypothetical protein
MIDELDNELDTDSELDTSSEIDLDLDLEFSLLEKPKKVTTKKVKRVYIDPTELHTELIKHVFNKKINPDYVMDKKLAIMCMKITDELFEKGNFRGYHSGWKYEMKSKAYENLVKYVHQYDSTFVDMPDFFVNWIYRAHILKMEAFFREYNLNMDEFNSTLKEVKKKLFRKSKDPTKEFKDTYRKVTAIDFFNFLSDHEIYYDFDWFKSYMYKLYPELEQQFEDHKKRNSFNYVTQMIYRSGQHVIKNEKKNKKDDQRLDEAILYRTDDFDHDAGDNDNRFITFDENKLDYGGFGY